MSPLLGERRPLNAFTSFLDDCGIPDPDSQYIKRSDCDTIFIVANFISDKKRWAYIALSPYSQQACGPPKCSSGQPHGPYMALRLVLRTHVHEPIKPPPSPPLCTTTSSPEYAVMDEHASMRFEFMEAIVRLGA